MEIDARVKNFTKNKNNQHIQQSRTKTIKIKIDRSLKKQEELLVVMIGSSMKSNPIKIHGQNQRKS